MGLVDVTEEENRAGRGNTTPRNIQFHPENEGKDAHLEDVCRKQTRLGEAEYKPTPLGSTHVEDHRNCGSQQDKEKTALEGQNVKLLSSAAKQTQYRHEEELEYADEENVQENRLDTMVGST